jgi:putative membrane protein
MKKIYWLLILLLIIAACNQRRTIDEADTEIIVGNDTEISDEEVEELVVMVMINNRLKTSLALLANEKAVNPRILSFSEMIIDHHDHFQMNMVRIAQAYDIEPPSGLTPEAHETFERLSGLPKEEFEKEFLNLTINVHEASLERFERLMLSSGHPIERRILVNVQETLQQHLEIAQNLQDEIIAGN